MAAQVKSAAEFQGFGTMTVGEESEVADFDKPFGRACSRNRRINSTALKVVGFCVLWSAESLQRNVTWPSHIPIRRPLEIAMRNCLRSRICLKHSDSNDSVSK